MGNYSRDCKILSEYDFKNKNSYIHYYTDLYVIKPSNPYISMTQIIK